MRDMLVLLGPYIGAAITAIALVLGWWQRRKRLDVKVEIKNHVSIGIFLDSVEARPQVVISATNPRPHTLVLTECKVIVPDNTELPVRYGTRLPSEIHPHSKDTCENHISAHKLANMIYSQQLCTDTVKVYGRYYDQSGKAFTSKPLTFHTSAWLKLEHR